VSTDPLPPEETAPPETARARPLVRRLVEPFERFLALDAAGGILLLAATAIALGWANSPWRASYQAFWHAPVGLVVAGADFARPLHFWINDGLMTVFFFAIGLEVRRELHDGDLRDRRRAALPLWGALGGMLLPAAIFTASNLGRPTAGGWGIPIATDIAFSLGLLTLLGRRVPPPLRVFLLALAVIDDIGAILVIALFYSDGLAPAGLAIAALGVAGILALQRLAVRDAAVYLVPGLVIWAGLLVSGVHPTLAGVLIGLLTPPRADAPDLPSPVQRLLAGLHRWVAHLIMPAFAFANAGVALDGAAPGGAGLPVFLGVVLGLVVGKPVGIVGAAWLVHRLGWAELPRGTSWPALAVIGMVAGVGFTMSLFIAQLALAGALLDTAKLAVLIASATSAGLALAVGRVLTRPG